MPDSAVLTDPIELHTSTEIPNDTKSHEIEKSETRDIEIEESDGSYSYLDIS